MRRADAIGGACRPLPIYTVSKTEGLRGRRKEIIQILNREIKARCNRSLFITVTTNLFILRIHHPTPYQISLLVFPANTQTCIPVTTVLPLCASPLSSSFLRSQLGLPHFLECPAATTVTHPNHWLWVRHTILFFSSALNILLPDSSIGPDSEDPNSPLNAPGTTPILPWNVASSSGSPLNAPSTTPPLPRASERRKVESESP
ncbi:hypothetical protein F5888DRAFT_263984 [Russula emetica]|nr:hypothetical protein F5888DRAFT_263984 [Russula emetica]